MIKFRKVWGYKGKYYSNIEFYDRTKREVNIKDCVKHYYTIRYVDKTTEIDYEIFMALSE